MGDSCLRKAKERLGSASAELSARCLRTVAQRCPASHGCYEPMVWGRLGMKTESEALRQVTLALCEKRYNRVLSG